MLNFTTTELAEMPKDKLRIACRDRSIGYNSLNNDGMRAALASYATDLADGAQVKDAPLEVMNFDPPAPPPVAPPVATAPVKAPKPPKEPKPAREESNGVKRPAPATICGQIWAWCDEQSNAGVRPEAKVLRAALPALDDTTKTVQFYRWRKFNGIVGR